MPSAADACIFCGTPFSSSGSPAEAARVCAPVESAHVCAACGAPQPIAPGEDYFSLLGAKRGFRQDLPALESRYYAISRALHPDRFAAGPDPKWKVISIERMSAVNRAYQTLTKADRLREYLLELEGARAPKGKPGGEKPAIPVELAEEWFDLQDAVMDSPPEALTKLDRFEKELKDRSVGLATRISDFEREYDGGTADPKGVLRKIEKLVLDGQYLKSMERDLMKLKTRLGI